MEQASYRRFRFSQRNCRKISRSPGLEAPAMTDLESFAFGDSPALADELLELVLAAKKTATCWAASEGDKGVEVGKRWIVKDGQGRPRAILETVEVERRRFEECRRGASPSTRARATGRLRIGAGRTRTISPGEASFSRGWRSIASGSGWSRSSRAREDGGDRGNRHREERSDAAIQGRRAAPFAPWFALATARDVDRPLYPSTNSLRGIPCA